MYVDYYHILVSIITTTAMKSTELNLLINNH